MPPPRPRPVKDRFRRARGRLLTALLAPLAAWLGRRRLPTVQRFGRAVGRLAWWAGRRDRRRAVDHLALAFPEMGATSRREIARASFLHQGTHLAEALHLLGGDCERLKGYVEVVGWERVEALRAAGRPVMVLSAHCGSWELLAALINCRGLRMVVIGRRPEEPGLAGLLLALRRRFGTETIERGEPGAARRLLAIVREGGALGVLLDQDIRVDSVFVPFFGHLAQTAVGPARLALRLSAAVVPSFIERLPDGRHRATFHEPLALADDPTEATAQMTAAIEAQVRRVPAQWVWMHRRWRRRPPDEAAPATGELP